MKYLFPLLLFLSVITDSQAQKEKMLKSWIKMSIENLSDRPTQTDTLYTRYSFEKSVVHISFYPGWNSYEQTWSVSDNHLLLGFDTYTIETLNDTSLTISLAGFRRVKLLSEAYLSYQPGHLISIGEYSGKPLYKANNYITPRYMGKGNFRELIEKAVTGYQVVTAQYFSVTFVVTTEGNIENIKVINSISDPFDKAVVRQLMNTSKKWKPAQFAGKPIQTEMFYDIKYLNSLSPYSSGTVH